METITLSSSDAGQRIDQFLVQHFSYSRNFFHHLLERGAVTVNDKTVKKSYRLKHNDTIQINSLERFIDGGILEEAPPLDLVVKAEYDDYLVVYKPKGVLSHPNSVRDISHPSIVGGLYHYFSQKNPVLGETLPSYGSFIRAGLLHRLDKETDGLMIIAKTEAGLTYFKNLFQQKSLAETLEQKETIPLKKFYHATSQVTEEGRRFLEKIEGHLPYLIDSPVQANVPHPPAPKLALTRILNCVSQHENLVRFDLEILTGRTHQIRIHLSERGCPIVGDYLYGSNSDTEDTLQLTAYRLDFQDLYGNRQCLSL